MNVEFSWHIPCGGDSLWMCLPQPQRPASLAYLTQVAREAETAGFDAVLVPCAFTNGNYGMDAPYFEAFTVGMACLGATERVRVTVAHRPGFVNPGLFAQMCATADDLAPGRLGLNIVTGPAGDILQFGDDLDHDGRYDRAAEYVEVLRRLWAERSVTHEGPFYRMADARLAVKPADPAGPRIHLVGASGPAVEMAAAQGDVYMMSVDTVEVIAARIAQVREKAAKLGREPGFWVAATLFAAETDEAARSWAYEFAGHADLGVVAERARLGRATASTEDLRARAGTNLHTWLTPHLWRGIAHLTHGSALVGSYDDLAALMAQYVEAGVTGFQLYAYPFLEQARTIGEQLVPRVKERVAAL